MLNVMPMYTLYLISAVWIPMVCYIMYLKSRNGYKAMYGYRGGKWEKMEELSDVEKFERIKVEYKLDDKDFVYMAKSDEFTLPSLDAGINSWIVKAKLFTKTFDDLETVENCTNVVKQYAGPQGDFHNSTFDVAWMFENDRLDFYKECTLSIWDNNYFSYKIDVHTNKPIDDTDDVIEEVLGIRLLVR